VTPQKITLRKLNTLENALYPQREKYPDGTERKGLMWDFSKPRIGMPFSVKSSKMFSTFHTSTVLEIVSETKDKIIFKTLNSTYELTIENE
jgi:hypothetical protein